MSVPTPSDASVAPAPAAAAGLGIGPERLVAQYRVTRQVGAGAMGVVYLARDVDLDRDVALKLLRADAGAPADARSHDRFLREARSAARLSHPNVAAVYQIGRQDGHAFIAMEWLDGGSLADHLRQRVILDWREATAAVRDAAAGLAAAHAAGIIHRDVKPSNLMRTRAGAVKLVDFGLAREAACDSDLTQTGGILGTPAYLSPEQCRGEPATPRSDQYCLACTWFHLLTSRPPFAGDTIPGVLYRHLNEPVPDPRRFAEGVPEAVTRILLRAAAKDPADRYPSLDALLDELSAVLGVPGRADRPAPARPTGDTLTRLQPTDDAATQALPAVALNVPPSAPDRPNAPAAPAAPAAEIVGARPSRAGARRTAVVAAVLAGALAVGGAIVARQRGWIGNDAASAIQPADAGPAGTRPADGKPDAQPATRAAAVTGPAHVNALGMRLVRIEPGTFVMGSPPDEKLRENFRGLVDEDQRTVTIARPYYIGATEVTQAQWRHVMGTDPSQFKGDALPVEQVSWDEAVEFCRRLSGRDGRTYRLPTEAKWEYAARAGTTTAFSTGPTITADQANFKGTDPYPGVAPGVYRRQTTPAGTFPPNPWGLYDMHGNVWEWCGDFYDATQHAARGGSWFGPPRYCRSAARGQSLPTAKWSSFGFRVVMDADEPR